MDLILLAMLQTADPPIIPTNSYGWWAWLVRNWIPLATMAAFMWKVAMKDQNEKYRDVNESVRQLNTKIGLPEGYTVKTTIDGLSQAVEEKLSLHRRDFDEFRTETSRQMGDREGRLRKVEADVRDHHNHVTGINKELGRMSSLFEQAVQEQTRGRELILAKLGEIEVNQARVEERSNFVPVLEKLLRRLDNSST